MKIGVKEKYFEKEMDALEFTLDEKNILRERMSEGLEIMTRIEITECLEEYKRYGFGK